MTGLKHLCVGDLVRENACHEGKDATFDTYVLDEDSEDKVSSMVLY